MGCSGRNIILSCFCCHSIPNCSWVTTSSCTKAAYLLMFFTCVILFVVASHVPEATRNLPFCKDNDSLLCSQYSNFPTIYRISFTYVLFFTVMCAFTFGVTSSRSYRSVFHNGFWFFKIVFIVLLLVGAAYMPQGLFDEVFMYFGLIFVLTFSLFEMFLFIQFIRDFSYICRIYCFRQASVCNKFIGVLSALLLQGVGTGIFIVLLILYSHCLINFVFTILNMCLSHLISLGSFFIKLQKRDWNSILEGSILTTHVMFLTLSAVTNNPRDECNPSQEVAGAFFVACNFIALTIAFLSVTLAVEYFIRNWVKEKPDSVTYVEERGKEFCGLWGKRKLLQIIQPEHSTIPPEGITYKTTDPNDDEYDHIKYFWYAMHYIFLQATFYFMICFTNNYKYSTTPSRPIFYNEAAMWFKIVSSWLCMLSFIFIEFLPESTRIQTSGGS